VTGFIDEAVIEVSSGHGGAGAVSFRREKFVPRGGPDGGDGGKGGSIIFQVKENLKTLYRLRNKRYFKADDGSPGKGARKHGRDGVDIIITVPPGTLIKDYVSKEIIKDLKEPGETWVFLEGGRGGQGNWHFRTARIQAPRFAQPGEPGKERKLIIEINLIADIGLVGLPNAGKSTLLSVVTNAHPEIAAYPFTTKIPNLGVMKCYDRDVIIADIPGIIEGASQGAGLGIQFLKHIARTFLIVLLVDLTNDDLKNSIDILKQELGQFSETLVEKSKLILGTKMDMEGTDEKLAELIRLFPDDNVVGISSIANQGLEEFKREVLKLLTKTDEEA